MVWTHQLQPVLLPQLTQWLSISISSGNSYATLQIWQVSGSIVLVLATVFHVLDFFIWSSMHNWGGCWRFVLRQLWIKTSAISLSFRIVVSFWRVCPAFTIFPWRDNIDIPFTLGQFFYFFPLLTKDLPRDLYVSRLARPFRSFVVSIWPSTVKCVIFLFLTPLSGFC